MDDSGWLLANIMIGCIGAAYFMYGKKAGRPYPMVAGGIMCVYPFFVTNVWLLWGICIALMV
ncbi:MAG TPA: amino acid transport protein, partial [Phycisphaerae bacterium]